MQANMGMAGEFRVVVKRADGSTKIDTGYQKNLILNQGLDFFGGGNGSNMMSYCVIGSGNSQPVYTQNKLDTAVSGVAGTDSSTKYDYDAALDGNLYKTNRVVKYSFNGLNNVNISELGLASTYGNATTYFLCTRALIKDSQGNPTTITVLSGEILEVYYKLWAVFDTTDKTGQLNVLDGVGNSQIYNYIVRLSHVGEDKYRSLGKTLINTYFQLYPGDIGTIRNAPSVNPGQASLVAPQAYTSGSYKLKLIANFGTNFNATVRSLDISYGDNPFGCYQLRIGNAKDDTALTKTNSQTLSIPIEFSWGRYESAL